MGIHIQTGASTYTALTGAKGIFVQTGATTYNRAEQVYVQTGASTYVLAYQYDIVGPVVPTPTVAMTSGTTDTVSWGAITDASSSVASATIYQTYTGSTSGVVAGTNQVLGSFGASNTTFAIPTNRRNTPTGETWQVQYYIIATDTAGNSTTGSNSLIHYTSPKGTYSFLPTDADSRNIGDTAWLGITAEGIIGISATKAYGGWFYGATAFTDKMRGWVPDSGTFYVKWIDSTDSNRGNSGTFTIKVHNKGTASGPLTFAGTGLSFTTAGYNTDEFIALTSSQWNKLADGTALGFGVSAFNNTTGFVLGSRDFSGLVTLVYS